jgi:hypothetical protein
MPKEWGPFITFDATILANGTIAFFAALLWSEGHFYWLVLKGKEVPSWLVSFLYGSEQRFRAVVERARPHHVYVKKGLGWSINLLWACLWLLIWPGGDTTSYLPVIDNIILKHVGGVAAEIVMFLALTGLFRWATRERRG